MFDGQDIIWVQILSIWREKGDFYS